MARITVASVCPLMGLSDPERNLASLTAWGYKSAEASADLLFLPETFLTGYATEEMYDKGYANRNRFLSLAEPVPGPTTEALSELSRSLRLFICVGILEREHNVIYNTQILVGPEQGYMGKYRKVQVGSTERWFSTPGADFPIFDIAGVPTGIMICRDKSHPEIARILALEGAQLVLNPHCTPTSPRQGFSSWSLKLCMARAMENGCYVIVNNPVFDCPIDDDRQAGITFALDPYGEIIHLSDPPGHTEKMVLVEVDTEVVRERREMEGKDFNLWSRSPLLYDRLVLDDGRPSALKPKVNQGKIVGDQQR